MVDMVEMDITIPAATTILTQCTIIMDTEAQDTVQQ